METKEQVAAVALALLQLVRTQKMSKSFKTEEGRLGSMLTHNPPFLSLCLNGTKKLP